MVAQTSYASKVIIACDFNNKEDLYAFLNKMGNQKMFLKLGMQILYKEGFDLVEELKAKGHSIFVDLKVHDIPNTAAMAVKSLLTYKPDFLTIHALGGREMMKAAVKQTEGTSTKILAVTILTSMNEQAIKELNISKPIADEVKDLMKLAKESGVTHVVCSAHEANIAKEIGLATITPGIRFEGDAADDQARIMTPVKAFKNGSTFIVMGRSITGAKDPLATYKQIEGDINEISC